MASGVINNIYGEVSLVASEGVTISTYSITKVGNLVAGIVDIMLTSSSNTWKNLFSVTPVPYFSNSYYPNAKVPSVRTGNGEYAGMVEINSDGLFRIYPIQSLSNNSISFSFAYKTNS